MIMGFEDLGGELGESLSAKVFFGLGIDMDAVFGKDGCSAASAGHNAGDGSVINALGLDDLEISTGGRWGGDDNPIGLSVINRAADTRN